MFSQGHVSKLRWWLIMGDTVPNGTFFIRVNTRLLSYRRNENAEEDGRERRAGGMERVSRQGNASAVNEQTLIFSRTKTHPLPPPIFYRPRASPCSGTRKRGRCGEEVGWHGERDAHDCYNYCAPTEEGRNNDE